MFRLQGIKSGCTRSRAVDEHVRRLRITGVGLCERLQTIGEELSVYANNLGVNLEFWVVEKNLENMKPEDIKVREEEVLVVNSILQLHCVVKESHRALNSVLQMIHGLGILVVLTRSFLSQPQTEMEAVCGSFWVTSSLPRSPKSTLPLFRSTHQHLIAFPSQFHLFLYRPPPYANAKTLCARTSSKPAIFLPHLIASLEQVDQTYIMVKPDGMQRGLVGEIIFRFEKKGFKLTDLKLFKCSKELAEEHYKDLKQKSFFPKLIDYITSGPVVCMAWEGVGVVASARKLIGATYPLQAEPDTIRGDLTVQTRKNVVHGSDNPENGKHEIEVKSRAPGKIILTGEHAVVHGSTAVASSIDLYTYVSLCFSTPSDNEDSLKLKLKEAALEFSWSITKIRAAFPESTTQLSSPPNSCSVENAKVIATLVEELNIPEAKLGLAYGVSAFL
ncbi:hypothetical protein AAZX31_20G040800 [Glycine max]